MGEVDETERCPCCGGKWSPGRSPSAARSLVRSAAIALSGQERIVAERLARNFGAWVPREAIVDAIFASRLDGGPLDAGGSAGVVIHRLRAKLQPLGIVLDGLSHHGTRMRWADQTP